MYDLANSKSLLSNLQHIILLNIGEVGEPWGSLFLKQTIWERTVATSSLNSNGFDLTVKKNFINASGSTGYLSGDNTTNFIGNRVSIIGESIFNNVFVDVQDRMILAANSEITTKNFQCLIKTNIFLCNTFYIRTTKLVRTFMKKKSYGMNL